MKLTSIRCVQYTGTCKKELPYREERLVMPSDVYPEFRQKGVEAQASVVGTLTESGESDTIRQNSIFLYVDTDDGVIGLAGPINLSTAFLALELGDMLIGQDALATQRMWDLMYRLSVHGRKGETMLAISAIDCALWDLRGKAFGQPVYRLLGGPTQSRIPAYVSTIGFSLERSLVAQRAATLKEMGFAAQKWFFRHGPASGKEGIRENLELAKTVRVAVGPDCDIMFDAWMGWDVEYTMQMIGFLEEYRLRWLEEPLLPHQVEQLAYVARASSIPITGGEHEYTRWGFHEILDKHAVSIIQPDPLWAGGITEMLNICSVASLYDVPVVPHGTCTPINVHLIASQPPRLCPLVEFIIAGQQTSLYFLSEPNTPAAGTVDPDDRPGLGLVIDESKVEAERGLRFK